MDAIIERKGGWPKGLAEEFNNHFIDLVESFNAYTAATLYRLTEEELDKEMNDAED